MNSAFRWEMMVDVPSLQERIVEQITHVPVPQIVEETVEVAKIFHQERVQQPTLEEIVVVPVPQFLEIPKGRTSEKRDLSRS